MPEPGARVLIVADDLTGALDTAGAFAQQGVVTQVVALPLETDPQTVREAQVVALNTASRHLPEQEAARRVTECASRFACEPFDYVYKKIDSTLRGNVVAETIALMEVCKRKVGLVAPAFPAQGRTVVNGVVYVEGVALAHTGFADDALSPPPLEPLDEVFGAALGKQHVGTLRSGGALPQIEEGVIIADAGSDADMVEVFDKAADRARQMLLVGSAGLGEVLAARLRAEGASGALLPAISGPIVFVVGSRAARSREQVELLRRHPHTVVIEAPNGEAGEDIELAGGAQQVVLLAIEDPEAEIAAAEDVAQRMAETGLQIAGDVTADAIVVTGGDTAIALLEASHCTVITVRGNLMPGIPYSSFEWQGRAINLVTKAGGFGANETMVDIVECLRTGSMVESRESA